MHEHADLRGERRSTTSRASTSCGRCAASTRACRAACTCTSARARCCRRCTRRPGADPNWRAERDGRARMDAAATSGPSATASRSCSTSCGPSPDPRACERAEELRAARHRALRRRAGPGASSSSGATPRRCSSGSPPTSWSASLLRAARPAPRRPRAPGSRRRSTSVRPFLGAHGGDVELLDIDDDGGRRAPAPARQLRRLPVVGGHAAARGRAGHRRGRARDRASSTSSEPASAPRADPASVPVRARPQAGLRRVPDASCRPWP